jgi:hypothetical protein
VENSLCYPNHLVIEMTADRNSFANARIRFGGITRGMDEHVHDLIRIDRTEGPALFGEYKLLFMANKSDFDVEIRSFGFVEHGTIGIRDRQSAFSATECEAIERLIRSFFSNPDLFKEQFRPPARYLGGLAFKPDWIIQASAKR